MKYFLIVFLIFFCMAGGTLAYFALQDPSGISVPELILNGSATSTKPEQPKIFTNPDPRFSIERPEDSVYITKPPSDKLKTFWSELSNTEGQLFVSFLISSSIQPDTNFSEARLYVSRSNSEKAFDSCLGNASSSDASSGTKKIDDTNFTRLESKRAGAGSLYEIVSYRTQLYDQCFAVEYFIRAGNMNNYPEGSIKEYDRDTVLELLEKAVDTLEFNKATFEPTTPEPTTQESAKLESIKLTASLDEKVAGLGVTITPKDVQIETRCPKEAPCSDPGTVRIRAIVASSIGTSDSALELDKPFETGAERITMIAVKPEPLEGFAIVIEEYEFDFLIEKLNQDTKPEIEASKQSEHKETTASTTSGE